MSPSLGIIVGSSILFGGALWMTAIQPPRSNAPQPSTGEKLFAARCAPCHGAKGKGGAGFSRPLVGTRSAAELAAFIHQTMPPGPKPTPIAEAKLISAYMYEAFYSPIAQDRNRPARVEVSRLTVRQFKNAVADLIGDDREAQPAELGTGLRGQYFKERIYDEKGRALDRVDRQINFNFEKSSPEEGKFDPHNFSMVWSGSVVAPDSGDYEFIVQSSHAVKLFVNFDRKPLVDAWVKSGSDSEFKETITLLGGRSYPIRLEFSKATQGVNDDEKRKKTPVQPAFVKLLWRRPKLAPEVIPTPYLYPTWSAPTYVVEGRFPPDDRSIGYERGNSVSKSWEEATTQAAISAGNFVSENIDLLAKTSPEAADRAAKVREYGKQFLIRAFRRPLDPATEKLYLDKQLQNAGRPEAGIKRVVFLALTSPRFLYLDPGVRPADAFSVASHLAFGLWDTVPPPQLLQAAAKGELNGPEQVARAADLLADNPRAWSKLRDFLLGWLKVDEVPELVKSGKLFPGFDEHLATDLRTSLELGLRDTTWGPNGSFKDLLLSQKQFINGTISKVYGQSISATNEFKPVTMDGGARRGVLGHPYVLARLAYLETSSPIHRGVLIARNMLGRTLRPPPAAFAPLAASLHPGLTTRERVAMQTKPDACSGCHSLINPLGFSLERYDAIGRIRANEGGKPIDSSGYYRTRDGKLVRFTGASDLAKFLVESEESQSAFVERLFHHIVRQPVLAYSAQLRPKLRQSFEEDSFRLRGLMVNIVTSTTPVSPQKTAMQRSQP